MFGKIGVILAAASAALVLVVAPASAKGNMSGTVVVSGADLAKPIVYRTRPGQDGPGNAFWQFMSEAALTNPVYASSKPKVSFGPKYTITIALHEQEEASHDSLSQTVHADLYPFASDGPWVYVPPQPGVDNGIFEFRSAWFPAGPDLVFDLEHRGLPKHAAVPLSIASVQAGAFADASSAEAAKPNVWPIAVASAVLALLLVATAAVTRRRTRAVAA